MFYEGLTAYFMQGKSRSNEEGDSRYRLVASVIDVTYFLLPIVSVCDVIDVISFLNVVLLMLHRLCM